MRERKEIGRGILGKQKYTPMKERKDERKKERENDNKQSERWMGLDTRDKNN